MPTSLAEMLPLSHCLCPLLGPKMLEAQQGCASLSCLHLHFALLDIAQLEYSLCRYADFLTKAGSWNLQELIMAVRRKSQSFSGGTSSYRGVTHHPTGQPQLLSLCGGRAAGNLWRACCAAGA